jgi:hypothetical protein
MDLFHLEPRSVIEFVRTLETGAHERRGSTFEERVSSSKKGS